MLNQVYEEAEGRMRGAIQSLEEDLAGIRTSRAHPGLVEKLEVEYYGVPTPLQQLATVSVPEPRSLAIKPFDKSMLKAIERAILASDLGLTPNNDGVHIRLNLPFLTEQRRRDLVKLVHNRAEFARVALRNVRRDIMKDLKDYEHEKMISEDDRKRGETEVDKITARFIEDVAQHSRRKELEIMEV